MRGAGFLFLIFATFCTVSQSSASTYVNVGDDVYNILARLEAEGIIRSGLLSTKPVSRKEAIRLLQEAKKYAVGSSEHIKSLVRLLEVRLEPDGSDLQLIDRAYVRYNYTDSDSQALNYNNDGDVYEKGANLRAGFDTRFEDFGRLSFHLLPELRLAEGSGDLAYKKAYLVYDFGWDLVLGKDSQWWGPGQHGALLLSNNAAPFTMVRINNAEPVILPWIFRHLGLFRFTFFVTSLEKNRADVSEPYLWGMRLNFKPHANIEIGLQKTAMLGGRGRPDDLNAWLKSFGALDEHEAGESGDQRAGYDVKLTLPFRVQPFQIYTEGAAEDSVSLRPVQWAYIYGIYLPRILSLERLEFRYEWAETYDRHEPSSWYLHHIYTSGYTYKSMIIGHHMGTNSRDNFLELTFRIPEKNTRLSLSYDVEEHNISQPIREKKDETFIRVNAGLTDKLTVNAAYGYGRIKNPGNILTDTLKVEVIEGGVEWRF